MTPAEINTLWRSLTRLYPAWSLPVDMFLSPSTWRLLGADLSPSVTKDKRARRVAAVLAAAPSAAAERMSEMARINVWRTTDIFRTVAVAYITLPITIGALLSDAAPDFLRSALLANIGTTVYWIIVFALTPIVYFCGMWRAKQLQWAIEYVKAGAIEPLAEAKQAMARA